MSNVLNRGIRTKASLTFIWAVSVLLVVACGVPGPTPTPTDTPSTTPTATPTQTPIATPLQTLTPTPTATPGFILFPYPAHSWDHIPNLFIFAAPNDPRIKLVQDAVAYWNQLLADIGTPFRLGVVTITTDLVPVDYLASLSAALGVGSPLPEPPDVVRRMQGDILLAMSDGVFISFSRPLGPGLPTIIGVRNPTVPPLNLTNVLRNVIAHELGHSMGLGHNNDPTTLMCGRPAPCRPDAFHSLAERFFPLTDQERTILLRLYPSTWRSSK